MKRYIKASNNIALSTSDWIKLDQVMAEIYHNHGSEQMNKAEACSLFASEVEGKYPDTQLSRSELRRLGNELFDRYF